MLQKSTTQRVLKIFFQEPTKTHYLKEISRKTGIAHTSISKILERFLEEEIIVLKKETRGSRIYPEYMYNFQNNSNKTLKRLSNLEELYSSGLIEEIIKHSSPRCITLFGSYEKGEDTEESDIDIFVESEKVKMNLEKYEELLRRKIELHFNLDIKNHPKELRNNIANGTNLFGQFYLY
ncbi:MAG: nucleotidyltransferase family protein [Nanoarchaeota archaeon]